MTLDRSSTFNISYIYATTLLFILLIVTLASYILIYLYIKNKRGLKYVRWKYLSDNLITYAIFFEVEDPDLFHKTPIPFANRTNKLLANKHFRRLVNNELISAKENMSGSSGENLQKLYLQINLDQYALKLLKSKSWYKISKAIQEFGVMELDQYRDKITPFINHKNILVRLEAQNTLLKFNGFKGLYFLDQAAYPITEWQQIKLLEQLNTLTIDDFTGIENWLKSKNDSVVAFALKLAGNYFQFQLHEQISNCLYHSSPEVRKEAILTLKAIPSEDTAAKLMDIYPTEDVKNKIEIIEALKEVGSSDDFHFLIEIIKNEEVTLQFKAAQTMASLKPNGFELLCALPEANVYPLNEIINHIKSELK